MSEVEITETTEEETTKTSEQEAFSPPTEATWISFIEIRVCCHNVVSTLSPFLNIPAVTGQITGIEIYFNLPLVSEHEVSDILPLLLSSLSYTLVWVNPQVNAALTSPSISTWVFTSITPTLSIAISNPNLYNESPTLNVTVIPNHTFRVKLKLRVNVKYKKGKKK
jgi:hypothetical protein